MVNIVKEQKGEATILHMAGAIEESSGFETIVGSVSREVVVSCKGVTRINSAGVVGWIRYFTGLQKRGHKLRFIECASPVVEQINMIVNFLAGGTVESIYVPYICKGCKQELRSLFPVEQLRGLGLTIPDAKCSACGGTAVFDDVPETYLGFLTRESK